MVKVWAVALMCGLLAPSHAQNATVQVSSSVSAAGLGSAVVDLLQDGDVIQRVLETVSGGLQNLGNVGAGLAGLDIKNLTLPKVSLQLLPGVGVQLNVYTKVLTEGKGLLGRILSLQVEGNISAKARLVQDDTGAPKFVVEDCKTQLVNVRILLNALQLRPAMLNNAIKRVLPRLLCPVTDTVLNAVNSLLRTVNSEAPLGAVGNLQYVLSKVPVVSKAAIGLDLNAVVKDLLGNPVEDPACSAASVSLPPVVGAAGQLGLSVCLLGSVLNLLQVPGKLDAAVDGQLLAADSPLTTSALSALIPEVSGLLSGSQQPLLKVRVLDTPQVLVENGKVMVHLPASVEVFPSNSSQQSLFVLNTDVVLSAQPTVSDNTLHLSLALERVNLTLASSLIGDFNAPLLEPLISDILRAVYVPHINAALEMGIPLPDLLNLKWENGLVGTTQNSLVVKAQA
ncbi:BPI fold-containing family B member 3 [Pelodiscus sinensis]|uniref:BPI fold-containing family B member 3 n=1 Tax=Pelodiscus sinensis TaxID=13735 RepID=UPI003F6B72B0